MSDKKETIIERHTVTLEDGRSMFKIADAIMELDARIKTYYKALDEVKEVLAGFAAWSEQINNRMNRIDPKIIMPGDEDFNDTLNKLK